MQTVASNDYWYLALNQARKPYDDPAVRQAIAFALDREAIAKAAKFGLATVNQTAIPAGSSWHYDYAPYSHDLDKAKSLLAGKSGLNLDLMVTTEYPETVTAAQVIAANLDEIGITVKIRTLDFAQWLDEQGKGNFDAFLLGWLGNIDPDEFYYAQHHTERHVQLPQVPQRRRRQAPGRRPGSRPTRRPQAGRTTGRRSRSSTTPATSTSTTRTWCRAGPTRSPVTRCAPTGPSGSATSPWRADRGPEAMGRFILRRLLQSAWRCSG